MGTGLRMPLRRLAYKVRAIPGKLGIRPYTVEIQVTTSSGTELGEGTLTTVTTQITEANGQPPKVRWLDNREIALGGYEDGTVEVGPITPDFTASAAGGAGGTSVATLRPDPPVNTTVRWVLKGPDYPATGGRFRVRNIRHDKTLSYFVLLERASD